MFNVQLLDVTLRDGGYQTNFHFSSEIIRYVLSALDKSGIEYIEVGYKNGSFKPIANIGAAGMCSREYLEYCRKWIKRSKLTVIFHPKNIQEKDIEELKDCGVDSVRIVFPAKNQQLGFSAIELAHKYGLEVFANITRASEYSLDELGDFVSDLSAFKPRAIYLADSNGSLTPDMVVDMYSHLHKNSSVPFGFHAHDNLCLAQANAISAMSNNVEFLDTSLLGLGKGSGNLRTEGFVSFLHSKGFDQYDLCKLLEAASFIKSEIESTEQNLSVRDIILGVFDLSQDDAAKLGEVSSIQDYYCRAEEYYQVNKKINLLSAF